MSAKVKKSMRGVRVALGRLEGVLLLPLPRNPEGAKEHHERIGVAREQLFQAIRLFADIASE